MYIWKEKSVSHEDASAATQIEVIVHFLSKRVEEDDDDCGCKFSGPSVARLLSITVFVVCCSILVSTISLEELLLDPSTPPAPVLDNIFSLFTTVTTWVAATVSRFSNLSGVANSKTALICCLWVAGLTEIAQRIFSLRGITLWLKWTRKFSFPVSDSDSCCFKFSFEYLDLSHSWLM